MDNFICRGLFPSLNIDMHPLRNNRLANYLAYLHGFYYLVTGLWSVLHIDSFMVVTGPKEDIWLVKTVGMLVMAIGAGLMYSGFIKHLSVPILIIAIFAAVGFILVDVVYVFNDTIQPIYLLDAIAEMIIVTCWIVLIFRGRH